MISDLSGASTAELLQCWAAIMRELRVRDVIRTSNNPVGDIAEALVHAHYGGTRANFAHAGHDVVTDDGLHIEVKSMRQTSRYRRTTLSPIRGDNYEVVVVVVFDEDFGAPSGYRIPREVIEEKVPVRAYVNGRVINLTSEFLRDSRITTVDFTETFSTLHPAVD